MSWSVQKFTETDADKATVERLFKENAIASFVSTVIIGLLLKDWLAFWFSMAGAVAVIIFLKSEYDRAFAGTL